MKKDFSSISERDISGFSDKDLEREIKRRNNIQFYLMMILCLLFLPLNIKLLCKAYEEKDFLSFVLCLVIAGILDLIKKILENIKLLRTEHLERHLQKRKEKRQKERETEEVLFHIEEGDFTSMDIDEELQQEVFQIFLKYGAVKITPTTKGNVKISISPSFKGTKLGEISNNEVLKYFRMHKD